MPSPTFDASTGATITGSPATFSHTCTGSNLCLYVIVAGWYNAGDVTAVTYNGVALAKVADSGAGPGGDRAEIWRLKAPSTGANTVSVTMSAAPTARVQAVSYAGVDQTTPEGAPATAAGNSAAPSVTVTAAAADIVIDGIAWDGNASNSGTMNASSGRTQIFNALANAEVEAVSRHDTPAASQAMGWTLALAANYALAAIGVKGVTAAAVDIMSVGSFDSKTKRPAPFKPGLAR